MARRSSQEWEGIIEQQKTSGLSVVDFCKQQQLNSKYFYARQRNLLKRMQRKSESSFIKVGKPVVASGVMMSLQVGEAKLLLPTSTEPGWVANLLKALSA